jgi:flavin-dependent dehydrogenase
LGNRSAWGTDDIVTTDFIMHPFGTGWHLDRAAFDSDLRGAAREAGARAVAGTVREIRGAPRAWELAVDAAGVMTTIASDFVIDCSGRRSMFARRQGARRQRLDRLVACAALFEPDPNDDDAVTLVEAVRDGWWYSARLPDATRIVMYFTDSDQLGPSGVRQQDGFLRALASTAHIGACCASRGNALRVAPCVFVADTARLDRVHGDGWIAAGDAAASFDPVSSQGIMTAIRLGQQAAQVAQGDDAAEYAAGVDALFDRYWLARAALYAQERRWSSAPFWNRRHG